MKNQCHLSVMPFIAFALALFLSFAVSVSPRSIAQEVGAQEVETSSASPVIDVQAQIFPILTTQCISCHGPDKADGELRLDRLEHIERGGHSGNPILGNVELSELLRRISSSNPDYRMPEGQPPLSDEQIELFRAWIASGAEWPEDATVPALPAHTTPVEQPKVSTELTLERRFNHLLDDAMSVHEKISVMLVPLLGLLIAIVVFERAKKNWLSKEATARSENNDVVNDVDSKPSALVRAALSASGLHYLSAFLIICMASLLLYHVRRVGELNSVLLVAKQSGGSLADDLPETRGALVAEGLEIYRSKHPPRMGGDYYRGNDERNQALFNNGYYRTAVLSVSLRDQNDRRLDWNDRIETEKCFVKFEVEQSPYATPELFQTVAMRACYVMDATTLADSPPPAHLTEFPGGKKWYATYPIIVEQPETENIKGILGVYNGSSPHYAVGYDIKVVDGVIAPTSELWLGSVLLPGKVVFPKENEIAFNEWFDFLPIPEITRPHTSDPELLGISEHEPYLESLQPEEETPP